jgi:type I restriction enzyme S subunit
LPILAISQEFGAVPRELINYQISVTEKSIESYKVIEVGDFIISLRSFQGGIEYSNFKGICSPAYIILRPFIVVDRMFFKYYFKTFKYIQHLNSKLEGIRDGKMISYKYFSEIAMPFPTLPEQTRIASFFTVLDKKITELKQKKNLLEQYKKGVMQKLFSQELRFKDENGKEFPKWEKKKLGEIGTFQTSSVDKLYVEGEREVFLVNYMNVYKHENLNSETIKKLQVVTAKDSQIVSSDLKKGDILFTPSSETPSDIGHSVVIFEDLDNCVYSYHLMRFRPTTKIDLLYSHYFCNIPTVLNQFSKLATGSTRFTISVKSFSSIEISLPSQSEQTKIAIFLSAIDDKINRTENQLQQTQQYKKGLLQKMFCE